MELTVEEYWREQIRTIESKNLAVGDSDIELEDGDLFRGQINSRIYFYDEDIHLTVHETVSIVQGTAHRERYSYQLMVRGVEGRRWCNDPTRPAFEQYHIHDPMLGLDHEPDEWISITGVIRHCWNEIDSIEEAIRSGDIEPE